LATGWAGWDKTETLATIASDAQQLRRLEAPLTDQG
jgi:hypothetical protein